MPISRLYNKTVSTKRLSVVGSSKKERWQTNIEELECALQPTSREQVALGNGAYYKTAKMYCDLDTDIEIGDKVVDGGVTYQVKGKAEYDFGNSSNNHLIIELVQGL